MSVATDVALVSMPFGPLYAPSIGLALLKAALSRIDVSSRTFYFTFDYAKRIGDAVYARICDEAFTHHLVGEWIFSASLFDRQTDDDVRRYVEKILRPEAVSDEFIGEILGARDGLQGFLDDCLDRIIDCAPRIVGFTSIFQQHVASLSLAKRIKSRRPEVFVVFGGANCEGPMGVETLRQFRFVDAVVSGEGDVAFPELVRCALDRKSFSSLQGVYSRHAQAFADQAAGTPAAVKNMDALPTPDYEDYFAQFGESHLGPSRKPSLLFETSRGCWWGEKHHCTFCGLNGQTMAHRSKSAQRALDELVDLTTRHPGYSVNVVDNILDMSYFKDFIPMLAQRKLGVELFYEVKANLKKEQVRLLRDAGVTTIQPGIESLSDGVLQIMRKGVTALQNIQLLKWCRQFGIVPQWNLIWGFPGELPEEYKRMTDLIPLLTHLPPPQAESTIRIDRFSPNFNQSDELGFKNLSPYPAYGHVYPFPRESLQNLAYFFMFEYSEPRDVTAYAQPLAREIGKWRKSFSASHLFWIERGDRMLVWDSRTVVENPLTVLTGLAKFCYKACDAASTPAGIRSRWATTCGEPVAIDDVTQALEELTQKRLMLRAGEQYLALAIQGENQERESLIR